MGGACLLIYVSAIPDPDGPQLTTRLCLLPMVLLEMAVEGTMCVSGPWGGWHGPQLSPRRLPSF